MTFTENIGRRWSGYIIYALMMIMFFLYLLFPVQQFKSFSTDLINRLFPGHVTTVDSWRYQFPLTLVVTNLQLQARKQVIEADKANIILQQATITPSLRSRGKTFFINITAYGGSHQATLEFDRRRQTFSLPTIEIKDLDLAKLSWLQNNARRDISGLLTATGSYAGKKGRGLSGGTGRGKVQLKNGTIKLLYPILSLENIDVKNGDSIIELQDQKLLLTQGQFSGEELEGTFTGQVDLRGPSLADMQLDLSGTLMPLPPLLQKNKQAQTLLIQLQQNQSTLPFQLKGTIGQPIFLSDS